MPKKRDLFKSLRFRYWIESVSDFLFWMMIYIIVLIIFAAAGLACAVILYGPTPSLDWDSVTTCLAVLVVAMLIAMLLPVTGEAMRGFSKWRDDHAARKGLTYWPYELTEAGLDPS